MIGSKAEKTTDKQAQLFSNSGGKEKISLKKPTKKL
jgi:hypothetical protein